LADIKYKKNEMSKQGFQTFNKFKTEIKELKQLYDITFHLYIQENDRLKVLLSKSNVTSTMSTNVGIIEHGVNSLFVATQKKYPNKLRQLILVSSITTLEVFLTDLIGEIFLRDKSPFEEQNQIEFMKGKILNASSIKEIQDEIISRDMRRLTSGGFSDIKKYYLTKFKIDFSKFLVPINEIEEIHTRRHIHVHRNGVCDKEYANKYPKMNFLVGEKIDIEHDYLVLALDKLSLLASEINKSVLEKYPNYSIGYSHFQNIVKENPKIAQQKLMLEFRIKKKNFDIETYLKNAEVPKHKLIDYIKQISLKDRTCFMIIFGEHAILTKFFSELKSKNEFELFNIIELMN
jgi:hypothetical protein